MLFNTWTYLIFFLISALILRTKYIPWKFSLAILSIVFYIFWDYRFLPLLLIITVVNFLSAKKIEESDNDNVKRLFLILSVSINLGFLIFFKYILLLLEAVEIAFDYQYSGGIFHSVILPLGISFYTFQAISYVVDVYRKEKKAEKSYLDFSLFIIFSNEELIIYILSIGNRLFFHLVSKKSDKYY